MSKVCLSINFLQKILMSFLFFCSIVPGDDLESLGYVLLYFLRGRLQDVVHSDKRLYLVFEYLDLDLKKHMDSCLEFAKDPRLIKVCFFRQFVRSVPKVDYLTLRHGFIMAHLAPQSAVKFDFRNYIKRSLEEDFKVVVGISPTIWFFAVIFLLFNTHGWYSYLWLPFIPLIVFSWAIGDDDSQLGEMGVGETGCG